MAAVSVSKFDLYAQLCIWIISLSPFILYFKPEYSNGTYWGLVIVYHAAGLFILGLWQLANSVFYMIRFEGEKRIFFRNNILFAWALVIIFVLFVYTRNVY